MTTAEKFTAINARFYADMRRADKFPPPGVRGASGVRRDRLIAKARRRRSAALAGVINPAYLR